MSMSFPSVLFCQVLDTLFILGCLSFSIIAIFHMYSSQSVRKIALLVFPFFFLNIIVHYQEKRKKKRAMFLLCFGHEQILSFH